MNSMSSVRGTRRSGRWREARTDGARRATSIAAFTLAGKIRRFGHLAAQLDPLGFHDPIGDPSLAPQSHGLTTDALKKLPASIVSGPAAAGAANAFDAIARLREIYCSTTGHDYSHVFVPDERAWLRQAVESGQFRPPVDPIDGLELLDRITEVETFERFLHRTFPGKTRFSIEGLDMMVPIIDEIIHDAAEGGVQHVMIAMAHRGRLNVLAHILQKPYTQILAEFKDPILEGPTAGRPRLDGRREVPRRRADRGAARGTARSRW